MSTMSVYFLVKEEKGGSHSPYLHEVEAGGSQNS